MGNALAAPGMGSLLAAYKAGDVEVGEVYRAKNASSTNRQSLSAIASASPFLTGWLATRVFRSFLLHSHQRPAQIGVCVRCLPDTGNQLS
jgi:hypothetical protein